MVRPPGPAASIEPGGGWCWRLVEARLGGVPLPALLRPRMRACKRIDAVGRYRFEVEFAWPWIGTLLGYAGPLQPVGSDVDRAASIMRR